MEKDSTSFWADIKKYEDVLAKDSRSYCFAPLSELYRKLGLLDDAVSVAKKGIETHPEYIGGFMVLGRALFEQGKRDEARASLEKVVLATPENLIAQRILSQIYQEEGNLIGAERALQLLVTFNPEDTASSFALEVLQRSMRTPSDDSPLSSPALNLMKVESAVESSGASVTIEAEQTSSTFVIEDSFVVGDLADAHVESNSAGHALLEEDASATGSGILPLATVTLAELYEGQGFLEKALEVYMDLLNKDPESLRLKERVTDLSIRLGIEPVQSPVSEIYERPGIVDSTITMGVPSADMPEEDHVGLFPNGQGRDENILDLLELWLDAIRRRKECR